MFDISVFSLQRARFLLLICDYLCQRSRIGKKKVYSRPSWGNKSAAICCTYYRMGINRLTPNDSYTGRTAALTSKRCILYIYSTNIGTEYFKHALYSPFFSSSKCSLFHNANLFGSCIIHILYTGCAKIKKNNSGAKGIRNRTNVTSSKVHIQRTANSLTNIIRWYVILTQ